MVQKWLARLSFSFLIVAVVLLWEANKLMGPGHEADRGKLVLYCVAITVLAVLGGAGLRARHRQEN